MSKEYTKIDERMQAWMERQQMFFVATAPLSPDGLVNCSPKGLDSLRILGPNQIAYLDLGGSGIETVAHLKENARIVIMMCAFDGPPKIFRFYGTGTAIEPQHPDFADMLGKFPEQPAVRNFIRIDIERIRDSCGFGVPLYEFQKHRESLTNHYEQRTKSEIEESRLQKNSVSLDGLEGLMPGVDERV